MEIRKSIDRPSNTRLQIKIYEGLDNTVLFRNRKSPFNIKENKIMKNDKEIMKDDMVTKLAILLFESGKASTMTEALDSSSTQRPIYG